MAEGRGLEAFKQCLHHMGLVSPTIDLVAPNGEALELGANLFQTAVHVVNQPDFVTEAVRRRYPALHHQFNNYLVYRVLDGQMTSATYRYCQ
jgi:hypothetical protein